MGRRSTLPQHEFEHPETGRTMRVKWMEGGGFDVIILNPHEHVRPMAWAVGGLFTGGKTGTRMRLFERPVVDEDED